MKILFCCSFIILTIKTVYSQNITGVLLSTIDSSAVEGAHILNNTTNKLAISSELGYFSIQGNLGDTIVVSNVNYLSKQFIVKTRSHISLALIPNMIQLEEVIVSNLPTTAASFRKKLIEMPMQDNGKFLPYGLKPAKPRSEIPPLYKRSLNSGVGYVVMNPLKSITRKLSSEFQEKLKYYALKADEDDKIIRDKKFNRSIVGSLTELKEDELTDFINFMKLENSYLNRASAYDIAEKIQQEFERYRSSKMKK